MNFKREQLKSELNFLKDLFATNLPVGENTKQAQEYFSRLEELISTKDPDDIQREEFPPDDPAISGSREYRYYSSDQFKKLASGHPQPSRGQDLGHTESKQEKLSPTENRGSILEDLAHLQEHPTTSRAQIDRRDHNPDLCGELDRGNDRKFPNIQIDY